MAQAVLSVRMDEQTKKNFALFCEEAGMSVSTAINLFARQTLRERKIPFEISLPEAKGGVLDRRRISAVVEKAARRSPALDSVILFGSYARGDATAESDIDLRITYDADGRFTIMNLAAFSGEIERETGKSVDVVSARAIEDKELADAIAREGVLLYER